jgi:hypothetical protein
MRYFRSRRDENRGDDRSSDGGESLPGFAAPLRLGASPEGVYAIGSMPLGTTSTGQAAVRTTPADTLPNRTVRIGP